MPPGGDLKFTITMDADEASKVMKFLKGEAKGTAKAVEGAFNTALILAGLKAGAKFASESMQEYAKESDEARRQVEKLTRAWSAFKAEVGFGAAQLFPDEWLPTPEQIRRTAGMGRALVMGFVTEPRATAKGAWELAQMADQGMQGNTVGWARHMSQAMLALGKSDAFIGGMQSIEAREKAIVDSTREKHKMYFGEQSLMVGASDVDRERLSIQKQYREDMERIKQLKQESSVYAEKLADDDERDAAALRDARLAQAELNENLRRRQQRFSDEEDAAAATRVMRESRQSFREDMKRRAQDRAIEIRSLREGDTLELAQQRARLQAERDIYEIRHEKIFNDPGVQKQYIDEREKQLKQELDALKFSYSDRNRYVASGNYGGSTLYQQMGPAGNAGSSLQNIAASANKTNELLEGIKRNTDVHAPDMAPVASWG